MKHTDKTSKALRDLFVIAPITIIGFILACHFQLFEWVHQNTRYLEVFQIDEIFVLGFILALAFGIFSLLRWLELRRVIKARAIVQAKLEEAHKNLEEEIRRRVILEGILPICSYCHDIRDENDNWSRVETYIKNNSEAEFSHGICPPCYKEHFPGYKLPEMSEKVSSAKA